MPRSEVFNNYLKIAEEAGFFKEADEKESKELKKYKDDSYPRVGSDDISTIEALYGIKPDDAVIKYDDNIIEAAHPESVVIAPSYDKINGLVENNNERQNIILHLVMKQNNGILNQTRYAEKELLMNLVRLANDLDFRGEDELRKLADECIEQIAFKKKADNPDFLGKAETWLGREWGNVKEEAKGAGTFAIAGGILGGILGAFTETPFGVWAGIKGGAAVGGAIGGVLAAVGKTAPQVVSVSQNAKDAVSQIKDLQNKIKSGPEFEFLAEFSSILDQLGVAADQYNELLAKIHTSTNPTDAQDANQKVSQFLGLVQRAQQFTAEFNDKVNRQVYNQYRADMGHWYSKIVEPVYSIMDDDVEDVQKSLQSLNAAVEDFEKAADIAGKAAQNALQQTQEAQGPQQGQPQLSEQMDVPSLEISPGNESSAWQYLSDKEPPESKERLREFFKLLNLE